MDYPKDLKNIIKERKRLESNLGLVDTICDALKLLEDEYRNSVVQQWRFKTIKKEHIKQYKVNATTVTGYSFSHRGEEYSIYFGEFRRFEYNIEVKRGDDKKVFEVHCDNKKIFNRVNLRYFLPKEEWHTTLLNNLKAFLKEAMPIIRAENKKLTEEQTAQLIEEEKRRFVE